MATKSGAVKRNEPAAPASGKTPSKPVAVTRSPHLEEEAGFDRLIYERVRLGIMSALATNDQLGFNELKSLFDVSDGNLSAHARKLEEAGYVVCTKSFEGRQAEIRIPHHAGRQESLAALPRAHRGGHQGNAASRADARRHHHGRKRPLGHPARAAAQRGAYRRREGGARPPSKPRRGRTSRYSLSMPSHPPTGRARPPRSRR